MYVFICALCAIIATNEMNFISQEIKIQAEVPRQKNALRRRRPQSK